MALGDAFTPTGSTEQQKNAELAIYLLRHLEHKRDRIDRVWPGEQRMRTLQLTCHVVEALHRLNLPGVTEHLIEPAAKWLTALPVDLPSEDRHALSLYPSRFKTLALINRFDHRRLKPDFTALNQLFNPESGLIENAPLGLSPMLCTLIWVDTLLSLPDISLLTPDLQAKQDQALRAISAAFDAWAQKATEALRKNNPLPHGLGRGSELTNAGDASYALDILRRTRRIAVTAPQAEDAREILVAALRHRRPSDMRRPSDLLYCGLQLRAHFPSHEETRNVVQNFITELRERYATDEFTREQVSTHALTLRLLAAHEGGQLRDAILAKLWEDNLARTEEQQQAEDARLNAEFSNLIRHSIRIELARPQRITGTRARGEVYRLRFGLSTEATDERGGQLSIPRNSLRLIVKKGSPEVLVRAARRYRELPEKLQKLFAHHADIPEQAPGYLIMQELADMQPLSETLAQLDSPMLLPEECHRQAAEAAEAVSKILRALHDFDRRTPSVTGYQVDAIYLTPMAECRERLGHPLAFPELKQWLDGSLTVNGQTYKKLDWYLGQLRRNEARLRPPTLGYAHGDCHTRNLMLTRDRTQAKLVDIDTLTHAEDFVVDYGLLIEDAVVYQSLPYGNEPGRLMWDDIQISRPENVSQTLENWISYPAFPRSDGVLLFQRELMQRLSRYADGLGDENWQRRLWLGIARGLLLLANRQLTSQTVEPRRRPNARLVNETRLVQVTYAETLRLLHELVDHLDPKKATPLPELPFPGERVAAPASSAQTESAMVANVIEAILRSLSPHAERRPFPGKPYLIDFFTLPDNRLFARVHATNKGPALYLACRPEQLEDLDSLVESAEPGEATELPDGLAGHPLCARVRMARGQRLPALMALVQQAYELATR
jgi:hypothetical protein